jgi:hypothetical protein
MYVTAHRVHAPKGRREGINAYLHRHGPIPWPAHADALVELLARAPGDLLDQQLGLEPVGGNDVLAYLDILAPDETPRSNLIAAIDTLFQVGIDDGLVVICLGPILVRLGIARARLDRWQQELVDLAGAVEDLLRRPSRLKPGRPVKSPRQTAAL